MGTFYLQCNKVSIMLMAGKRLNRQKAQTGDCRKMNTLKTFRFCKLDTKSAQVMNSKKTVCVYTFSFHQCPYVCTQGKMKYEGRSFDFLPHGCVRNSWKLRAVVIHLNNVCLMKTQSSFEIRAFKDSLI